MSEMTAREHALRVGVLDVISDETAGMLQAAREDAAPAFAEWRADGERGRLKALLPGGAEIGLVSVKAGGKKITATEGTLDKAIEKWVREHLPDGIEYYLDESALMNAEVLDVMKAVFPHLVKSRVREATRKALVKEVTDSGGWLVDKSAGEKEKVAEVEDQKPAGTFAFRPSPDARDLVIAAWQRGELRHLGLGAIALPGAAPDPGVLPDESRAGEPPAPDKPRPGALYADEYGFISPELAAAYAMAQGGFTTPPIEAYGMARSCDDVEAGRALAWLEKHGLDPADPREGRDTPWPLPETGVAGE